MTGVEAVEKTIARVDRKLTRDRQKVIIAAARKTLQPAVKGEAPDEAVRDTKVTMKRAVSVRRGKNDTVLVGPRGGKKGVWFRHITIGGAKAHMVGVVRKRGAGFRRRGTRRPFLFNPAAALAVTGPIPHPGRKANPFVERGVERGRPAFIAAVRAAIVSPKEETA